MNSADHALRNHVSRLRKVLNADSPATSRASSRGRPATCSASSPASSTSRRFERSLAAGPGGARGRRPVSAAPRLCARARRSGRVGRSPTSSSSRSRASRSSGSRSFASRRSSSGSTPSSHSAASSRSSPSSRRSPSEHPYRERFRAQLMLALYRSGRQAEGLDVYRRTRKLLREELGLEPGVELQQLERAILVQDPGARPLAVGRPRRRRLHSTDDLPVQGARAVRDRGRGVLLRPRAARRRARRRGSPTRRSCCSSARPGAASRRCCAPGCCRRSPTGSRSCFAPGPHSAAELERAIERARGTRLVVAVDQFEELFTPSVAEGERRAFIDALVEAAGIPDRRAIVVLALRADFFGRLAPYGELADLVAPNHVLLGPMSRGRASPRDRGARRARGPEGRAGSSSTRSSTTSRRDRRRCRSLRRRCSTSGASATGRRSRARATSGPAASAAPSARHAEAALVRRSTRTSDRSRVGSCSGSSRAATAARSPGDVRRAAELDADDDERVARVLATLVERRLLVADDGTVELVHEALLERWPAARRLARGGRARPPAAPAPDAGGGGLGGSRPRAERALSAAPVSRRPLEWADAGGDAAGLNRLERDFLEESRTAFAACEQAPARRCSPRLWSSLVVRARRRGGRRRGARRSAQAPGDRGDRAAARRAGARRAAASTARCCSPAKASSSTTRCDAEQPAGGASAQPGGDRGAARRRHAGPRRRAQPDGRMLAARGDDGSVDRSSTRGRCARSGRDFRSIGQLSYFGAIVRPVRALAFSPDGRTLAVGDSDGKHATRRTGRRAQPPPVRARRPTLRGRRRRTSRSLRTGGRSSRARRSPGGFTAPAEVLVARRSSDARAIRRSRPIPAGGSIGFANGGRVLLVDERRARGRICSTRARSRRRATFHLAGRRSSHPRRRPPRSARTTAASSSSISTPGRVRAMTRRAEGRVRALAFDADGTVLATTSDDGSVDVWDVPGGTCARRSTDTRRPPSGRSSPGRDDALLRLERRQRDRVGRARGAPARAAVPLRADSGRGRRAECGSPGCRDGRGTEPGRLALRDVPGIRSRDPVAHA